MSTPYETAAALLRPGPAHVPSGTMDHERVRAYMTYQAIWDNVPEVFAATLRADDDPKSRRYLPYARALIEAVNRFLAVNPAFSFLPGVASASGPAAGPEAAGVQEFFDRMRAWFDREEFSIKFASIRRWHLVKGDAILHLSADPTKPAGSRVSVTEIEPDHYFPVYDSTGDRVVGVHLASIVLDDEDNEIVQRITYRRSGGRVTYEIGFFAVDGWDDRDGEETEPVETPSWYNAQVQPGEVVELPPQVTAIPLYHYRNNRRGGVLGRFGVSELQGLESVLAGIVQTISDEDSAVSLMGIGVYATDSGGAPKDKNGQDVEWVIAPASVIELENPGDKFWRVEGVNSVTPLLEHAEALKSGAREVGGIPDVAVGKARPEASGVALAIEFSPLIARNSEKAEELASVTTHLLYDLINGWLPAYEGWAASGMIPNVVFDNPIPKDRAAVLKEVLDMLREGLVTRAWAADYLSEELGFTFPAGMLEAAARERAEALDAADPFAGAGGLGTTGLREGL